MNGPIGLYHKIYDYYKGDKAKLTLFTMVVLILSDLPLYFFTVLDLLRLPSLYKYRLHYAQEVSSHLGTRVYPPWEVIKETAKVAEFNFLFAYLVPGTIAIQIANKLKIFIYDTDREIDYKRLIKETFLIAVLSDVCFYLLHRIVHTPTMYQIFHKKHQ
jgi:sterol desaturase/sphingolipid hydroxylase (fatty acid hydroxylase superfamily)